MSRRLACLALALACAACGDAPPRAGRTVVLISIDTLRADRLGIYGNSADVSPNIDALARDSVVFDAAQSVAPWTLPSTVSMLTGLDPIAHGVEEADQRIPENARTAAEHFREHGYRTAAWTAGGFADRGWGLEDGFESFDTNRPWSSEGMGFSRYLEQVKVWLGEHGDEPCFLFLHSFDAHGPYDIASPAALARFRARPVHESERDHEYFRAIYTDYARGMRFDKYQQLEEALNDYDSGVNDADRAVGELVETLKRTGRYDEALIVVLSDHGESFYDNGLWMGHGLHMRSGVLRVPLVVKLPHSELAGKRVATLVDLVDVAPTLLDVAGLPRDERMQGSSLATVARGGQRSRSWSLASTATTKTRALATARFKYITASDTPPLFIVRNSLRPETPPVLREYLRGEPFHTYNSRGESQVFYYPNVHDPLGYFEDVPRAEGLYDREADPAERINVLDTHREEAERLRQKLEEVVASSRELHATLEGEQRRRTLGGEELRQLRELGYTVSGEEEELSEEARSAQAAIAAELERTRKDPPLPPPGSDKLTELDRRVHRVRLKLRRGERLDEADRAELADCAEGVTQWLESTHQPRWGVRAFWRVLEIRELATQGGFEFPIEALTERLRNPKGERSRKETAPEPADDGAEGESNGTDKPRDG
ncbi:MAG: sulfatase [Planctomycetota bacterium]|nr:sulfatase [Planctomycetota bacterium]